MSHPVDHFLAEHFPKLDHPAYQTPAEKITFIAVTSMMLGLLVAAVTMIVLAA